MSRALVLGGSGFIGAHLAASLAGAGQAVTSVGRRFRSEPTSPLVTQKTLDLYACSADDLRALVAGAEVVYHLAWSTYAATAASAPARDLTDNVGFFVRLLEALAQAPAALVFCSSGGTVYGPADGAPLSEDHPLRPATAYGAGKLAAEIYADTFRQAAGLDVRIARLANPYGVGQDPDRLQGALTRFAAQAVRGQAIEIWGDGSIVRDYLHVDDAVAALQRLGDSPREALGSSPVFNIGSGHGASLKDLIGALETHLGRALSVSYGASRAVDLSWNVLNVGKIERVLGWKPAITLDQGISMLLGEFGRRSAIAAAHD